MDPGLGRLADASDRFTPADVGHASQQVAAATFEATLASGQRVRAGTTDYLEAIAATRPTLSGSDVEAFIADIARFERS